MKTESKVSVREIRWDKNYEALIQFRKENTTSWPQVRTLDQNEKKLGIWCQTLRSHYRNDSLTKFWIKRLSAIHFNFDGTHDNWNDRFEELKSFIQLNNKRPGIKHDLYGWIRLQFKSYAKLNPIRKKLLNSINFLKYFEKTDWDQRYTELKEFVRIHKRGPTKISHPQLKNWILMQYFKFKRNQLNDEKYQKLVDLGYGFCFSINGESIWNKNLNELIKFRESNPDRWPSPLFPLEKSLCHWCQTQRQQLKAGSLSGKKQLTQKRIDKLNQMGFPWSRQEKLDKKWNDTFEKLKGYIAKNNSPISLKKNKYLYNWLSKQKQAIRNGKLHQDKIDKLHELFILYKWN